MNLTTTKCKKGIILNFTCLVISELNWQNYPVAYPKMNSVKPMFKQVYSQIKRKPKVAKIFFLMQYYFLGFP